MYKPPTIEIQFNKEIESKALKYFRKAVIAAIGERDILFHNHDEDKLGYFYPPIQDIVCVTVYHLTQRTMLH